MVTEQQFFRPIRLKVGEVYYLNDFPNGASHPSIYIQVQLIKYDPCPAYVIVGNGQAKWRCPRDSLFSIGKTNKS